MANIRDVFADNLRGLLAERGAMAALSRATGISRVQLNRYLKGTIPSEANLALIAEYLGMPEHALFERTSSRSKRFERFVELAEASNRSASNVGLMSNWMCLYFGIPGHPAHVIRSVVILTLERKQLTFERFTRLSPAGPLGQQQRVSSHAGFVSIVGSHEIHVGVKVDEPNEPSIVQMPSAQMSSDLAGGAALVLSPSGPISVSMVAERMDGFIRMPDALSLAGSTAVTNLARGRLIRRMLDEPESAEVSLIG